MRTIIVALIISVSFFGFSQNTPELSEMSSLKKETESALKSEAQLGEAVKNNSNPKKKKRSKDQNVQSVIQEKELLELVPADKED